MSALMRLSVTEKNKILKNLKHDKLRKFNKELQKLQKIINEYPVLEKYNKELEQLKQDYINKLNTITTHEVDYERHNQVANTIESTYNQKLFSLKSKILSNRDKYLEVISNYNIVDNTKYIEDFFQDETKEYEAILNIIKKMDSEEYNRIKNLDNDFELKFKEAKVIYQKLNNSKLIKDEIETRLEEFDDELYKKAQNMLKKKFIDKKEYMALLDDYYMSQQNLEHQKIQSSFEQLGYTFEEDIKDNQLQYISTKDDEYKIAIRVNNGKVTLAFTRLIPKGATLSEYDKAKDVEMAHKWCSDVDKVKALMQSNGMEMDEDIRVEPTFDNIRYEEVDVIGTKDTNEEEEISSLRVL